MYTQKRGISRGTVIREIPAGRGFAETRETPESRAFPWNSRTGNSWEGRVGSHMGGREWYFPLNIPGPWPQAVGSAVEALRPLMPVVVDAIAAVRSGPGHNW